MRTVRTVRTAGIFEAKLLTFDALRFFYPVGAANDTLPLIFRR